MIKVIEKSNTIDISERNNTLSDTKEIDNINEYAQRLESLGLMVSKIAHDYNDLFAVILGNVDSIFEQISYDHSIVDNIREIENAVFRAADLSMKILSFSEDVSVKSDVVNLTEIVDEISVTMGTIISNKIYFKKKLSYDMPKITVDVSKIKQIVVSLLINASQAMDDNIGIITIETGSCNITREYLSNVSYHGSPLKDGSYVFLEVSDIGNGMSPEDMKNIFKHYFTTKSLDCGLGLSTLLAIVENCNGGIIVESEIGIGSKYKILFPINDVPIKKNDDCKNN